MILTLIFIAVVIVCLCWIFSRIILGKYYERKYNKYSDMADEIYEKDAELLKEYRRLANKYNDLREKFEFDADYNTSDCVSIVLSVLFGLGAVVCVIIAMVNQSSSYIERYNLYYENERQALIACVDNFDDTDIITESDVISLVDKIEAWNKECISNKYLSENPWTSWFIHNYNLEKINYEVVNVNIEGRDKVVNIKIEE